jgi:hypothetical protein
MRRTNIALTIIILAAFVSSCGQAPSKPAVEVVAVRKNVLPEKPDDASWRSAPPYTAALMLQDLVEPRLLKVSTRELSVRALTDGERVAFRLEWDDPTRDDLPGAARFADAAAVQLPAKAERDAPAPWMGEAGRPVEITYWSAFWQSTVDGRADDIKALYPGAAPDHYPFNAPSLEPGSKEQRAMAARYAPALALGNLMAGKRDRAVQDLIAEGPGTLTAAGEATSTGRGVRTQSGWSVVIARPLPSDLKGGGQSQIALAVWEGSHGESGSRKMRTGWIPFLTEEETR